MVAPRPIWCHRQAGHPMKTLQVPNPRKKRMSTPLSGSPDLMPQSSDQSTQHRTDHTVQRVGIQRLDLITRSTRLTSSRPRPGYDARWEWRELSGPRAGGSGRLDVSDDIRVDWTDRSVGRQREERSDTVPAEMQGAEARYSEGRLEGKVALVTGSTSGIGRAIAGRLAAEGAAVVINGHTDSGDGEAYAAQLPDAVYVRADVSNEDDARRLVGVAVDRWRRLDIVVNSAGWSKVAPFAELAAQTDEFWSRCLGINLMSIWYVSREAAALLRDSKDGSITNITSAAGIRAAGSSIPYAVSKAGANHLTRLLARALAPSVRVNAVAPGFVDTPLTASMPEEFRAGYLRTAPLQRAGTPDEIADACLFLICSTYATGEITVLDGGLSLA